MKFKTAFLLCLFSAHLCAQDIAFSSLNQAIMESDPRALSECLTSNDIPETVLENCLNTADAMVKNRRQDIDNFVTLYQRDDFQFISLSNPVPNILLPPQYAARCGEAGLAEAAGAGCVVGLCVSLCALVKAWRSYSRNEDLRDANRVFAVLVFTASVTGLLASLTYACFYEAQQCKTMGLKPYKWVCREYLEDMYKNALQVKQLLVEKLAHIS